MNNKLSIYREVLNFPCDILDLQEKIDLLMVTSKMIGYNIEVRNRFIINCARITFHNSGRVKFSLYFYYDSKGEYVEIFKCYYNENELPGEVEEKAFNADDVIGIGEMISKVISIM